MFTTVFGAVGVETVVEGKVEDCEGRVEVEREDVEAVLVVAVVV